MGLRAQAALDAKAILEESTSGFACPVTLTSPAGVETVLLGNATDVGQTIDPDTGQAVAGRRASVALAMISLPAMPAAVASSEEKPWLVAFDDIRGTRGTWKVIEVLPDRELGVVVLLLESWHAAPDP
jgi:hypothetical protein